MPPRRFGSIPVIDDRWGHRYDRLIQEVDIMSNGTAVRDDTIVLDGLRFHYHDWGDPARPPLVLLHAYLSHARSWDTVARAMADRFRVLALDQRGHGESDWADDYHEQRLVDDLAAFVEALGLAPVSLVGFSIGGSAACGYAARFPDRVERLVVLECVTDPEVDDDPVMRAHLATLRSLPDSFEVPDEAVALFRPLAPHAPEGELHHWMRCGLVQRPDARWGCRCDPSLRRMGTPSRLNAEPQVFAERLAQVTCPVLIVVGAESFALQPSERLAASLPRIRLEQVPRAGHWVPLDNPTGFLDVVGPFLDEAR
jgi:pimeloyl-ACP methyl ester carboxylesterase